MLDFQATDAVGMRVQSVAKIDGLTVVLRGFESAFKRVNVVQSTRLDNFFNCPCLTKTRGQEIFGLEEIFRFT